MSDLIEQLRKERSADVQDAADRLEEQELLIEAQQAEIARLRKALEALQRQALQSPDLIKTEWGKEALNLSRAALEQKP